MKIALLNLPFDNNYGGNLQRYALIKTLESKGHEVVYLFCDVKEPKLPLHKRPFVYLKRLFQKNIMKDKEVVINRERLQFQKDQLSKDNALSFVKQEIPHTQKIWDKDELCDFLKKSNFDAIVVGSDQVWRKTIAWQYGINTYFLDFPINNCKKLAFAASFGTDTNELSEKDIIHLGKLYKNFSGVSVREDSGIDLINRYNWNSPQPEMILDPTFLLTADDYRHLYLSRNSRQGDRGIFAYILDINESVHERLSEIQETEKLPLLTCGLHDANDTTIYQWLRYIDEAKLVITDSFHGVVFSIIFHKRFILLGNKFRGNSRFSSLFNYLGIDNVGSINWDFVDAKLNTNKEAALKFIQKHLS